MSFECQTRIIYGVPATEANICDFRRENPDEWDKIHDKWVFSSDYLSYPRIFIIGISCYQVDEGELIVLESLEEPPQEEIIALRRVLEHLDIKMKPTWFVMNQII